MKKYTTAIILTFTALFITSCSSQDDDIKTLSSKSSKNLCSETRTLDFPPIKFCLNITYDPSITNYHGFIYYNRLILESPYYDGTDRETISVLQSTETTSYDTWDEDLGNPSSVFDYYYMIAGEALNLTVQFDVVPYINYGNYKITLYDMYQYLYNDGEPLELGSVIAEEVQAGNYCTISNCLLNCYYHGQEYFYLKLYVEPID